MARRGQNEGSIRLRPDGRWEARIMLGYKRFSFYGRTREEVQDKLTSARYEYQRGLPVAVERQTVAHFLTNWLEESVQQSRRPSTIRSYRQIVTGHLIPEIGRYQLSKLSAQHIQKYMNAKLADGLSPRTVQYHHATLRCALNEALSMDLVKRNVAKLVKPPSPRRHRISPLSPDDARRLIEAADDHRLSALFTVALGLGLRQGEALGLTWDRVDFEVGTIRIDQQLQRVDGKFKLIPPKSEQSHRTVAMPATVKRALHQHRREQLEERLAAGVTWDDWNLVFTSNRGTPIDHSNVRRVFQMVLRSAGLPSTIRYHDLRHSCASLLLAQGVPERVVMEILGHSDIRMTSRYLHVLPSVSEDAAARMDAIFGGQS
jgi:integrase